MEEDREQAQTDSACNQKRGRRQLCQGEEQEERLHIALAGGFGVWIGLQREIGRHPTKLFPGPASKNNSWKEVELDLIFS